MPRYEASMGGGNSDYKLVLYTDVSGTTVFLSLYWRRAGSSSYTSYSGAASFNATIGGVSVASGGYNFNAPAGGAIGETLITHGSRDVGAVGTASVAGFFNSDTSAAGYGEVWGSQPVATVPPAPTNAPGTPDQATSTSLRYTFNSAGDGGSPIIRWEFQVASRADFVGAELLTSSGQSTVTGRAPDTTYYFRSRGVNAIGSGPWSAAASGKTLAASAPSLVVTAAVAGTSATLTASPHSSQPSPEKYRWERRVTGTTTPVSSGEFSGPSTVVSGLAQGQSYDWRLAAINGSYTSPYSAWQTVFQPNPNTNPGDYFDGSTPATGDSTYSWTGTANNSPSRAIGRAVQGWVTTAGSSGATATLSRQVGGRSQGHAARVTFTGDAIDSGFGVAQGTVASGHASSVAAGGVYVASAHVQLPGRTQRISIAILWLDASSAAVGSVPSASFAVPQSASGWTRVAVAGQAPAGAVHARIYVTDSRGAGWALWQGGDIMLVDDAMLSLGDYPYFDGNTPDTPEFDYEWLDAENASPSARFVRDVAGEDPLADPDCIMPPAPPRPPSISDECIEEVGIWRRYWAVIPSTEVTKWLDVLPTLRLTTGSQPARQVRIRVFENPENLPPESFTSSVGWISEMIVSYMPAGMTYVLDALSERATAVIPAGGSVSADHLLYGSGGGPASWPVLSCGMAYLISFDVPLDAPDGNLTIGVDLTRRF